MKLLKKKLDQMGKRNISLCLFFGNFVIFFTVYSVLFNDIYSADTQVINLISDKVAIDGEAVVKIPQRREH